MNAENKKKTENISVFVWRIGKYYRYLYSKTKGIFPKQKLKLKNHESIRKSNREKARTNRAVW